jgi:hypothetical protein
MPHQPQFPQRISAARQAVSHDLFAKTTRNATVR